MILLHRYLAFVGRLDVNATNGTLFVLREPLVDTVDVEEVHTR